MKTANTMIGKRFGGKESYVCLKLNKFSSEAMLGDIVYVKSRNTVTTKPGNVPVGVTVYPVKPGYCALFQVWGGTSGMKPKTGK